MSWKNKSFKADTQLELKQFEAQKSQIAGMPATDAGPD